MLPFAIRKRTPYINPLGEWAENNIRLEGRRFSFAGHEYLRAIYDDDATETVLMKAAQIGGTTWAILKAFRACLDNFNVIYFFPTRTDVIEFSKGRVAPLLDDNRFLKDEITETDTAGLKRVRDAHLYFRGMKSKVGMKSVPADMIVFDELDEASPDAKALARERLSHSDFRRLIQLSNPSIPDYGIDEAFQTSDQRHWFIRCAACSEWTSPVKEFPRKLGEDVRVIRRRPDGYHFLACVKCGGELDMNAGAWIPDYPDRPIHGYLLSQLFSPKIDPGEILNDYRTTKHPDWFFRMKIGVPWIGSQNRVEIGQVLELCGEQPLTTGSDLPCTMGVDCGADLHVVISRPAERGRAGPQQRDVIDVRVVKEFSDLDGFMERYKVGRCVIDALPETHSARAFASRFPGRVWLNYFNEHQKGSIAWNDKTGVVQENRTEILDASRFEIFSRAVRLPREDDGVREFARHMAANSKVLEEDEATGSKRFKYIKTGPDHFSMAFTYDLIARRSESSDTSEMFMGSIEPEDEKPFLDEQF